MMPNENRLPRELIRLSNHPPEEMIALFVLNKLAERSDVVHVEQHLLVCQQCQAIFEQEDDFVSGMIAELERTEEARKRLSTLFL